MDNEISLCARFLLGFFVRSFRAFSQKKTVRQLTSEQTEYEDETFMTISVPTLCDVEENKSESIEKTFDGNCHGNCSNGARSKLLSSRFFGCEVNI